MEQIQNRIARTLNAIHMEKVDKIPMSFNGPAYIAKRQGIVMAEAVSDYEKAGRATIQFCKEHPGIDTIHTPVICPHLLSTLWLSEVWLPGKELPNDALWQVHEYERMSFEDYEKIIEGGYEPWLASYLKELKVPMDEIDRFILTMPHICEQLAAQAHVPVINAGGNQGGPIEGFCGARTLTNFFIDIMEEPETVKAAMDKAFESQFARFTETLDAIPPAAKSFCGTWIGGWRAAPGMISHDTFMEFCWPYLEKMILATIERGIIPVLHFDSNWESELETIATLPPRSCVLMLDGSTNPRKARDVLGDRMCLMGDVPSSLLAFGSADETYNYVISLIDDIGPDTGLIISSGCDCPLNAKDENVDAMIQATLDYHVH